MRMQPSATKLLLFACLGFFVAMLVVFMTAIPQNKSDRHLSLDATSGDTDLPSRISVPNPSTGAVGAGLGEIYPLVNELEDPLPAGAVEGSAIATNPAELEASALEGAAGETSESDVSKNPAATGDLVPRYWRILKDARYLVPHRYRFSSDSETVWNGSASASIAAKDGNVTTLEADVMAQVSRANRFRGKRVKYSGWVRTRKAHINAWFSTFLWFRVEDSNGVVIAFQSTPGLAVGDSEWTEHVIVIDVPQEASVLLYGAVIGGAGTFWMDAASISVVASDEALTPSPRPPPGNLNLAIDPSRALPFPMNLDFEEVVPVHDELIWGVREQPTYLDVPDSDE